MTKKPSSTQQEYHPLNNIKGRSTRNTLGMDKEEFEQYKEQIIAEYRDGDPTEVSIKSIIEREQEKGIALYHDRLRRWLENADVEIRPQKDAVKKYKDGGGTKSHYLRQEQLDMIDQFENKSEIAQVAFDVLFGLPTNNVVLFFGPQKSVIFMKKTYKGKEHVYSYATTELTSMEKTVVQNLTNKADEHGLQYIIVFAKENNLKWYGNDDG